MQKSKKLQNATGLTFEFLMSHTWGADPPTYGRHQKFKSQPTLADTLADTRADTLGATDDIHVFGPSRTPGPGRGNLFWSENTFTA